MKLKPVIIASLIALTAAQSRAAVEHLMPRPFSVSKSEGIFTAPDGVRLSDPTECKWLRTTLGEIGLDINDASSRTLTVELTDAVADGFDYTLAHYDNEGYELSVTPEQIAIRAVSPTGVIRAAQTLSQLSLEGNGAIECVEIKDRPAFKVRGFMHDVGRSFLSVEELKREIDLLSRFKINTFHWHLTDYTGWRLEIKAYPRLTGQKGITRYPGMFYTQEEARELQDYAAERGMTVIPEIDMPGHSHPFEQALGHGMQTAEGIAELKVILTEVAQLFDKAPYIHIGGDEIAFNDQYLVDMIDFVHSLGKKAVIWNRYNSPAKKVDPATIPCDMTTNWATSGTLSAGVPNIDMRYNYTNHFDVFADLVGIFKSSIFYADKGNPDIAGTISAAWCDTKVPDADGIVRQNNIYANILASGERAWTGGGLRYIETGGTTLPLSGDEANEFADWERRFLYHKNSTLAAAAHQIPYVRQSNVRWMITDQIPNGGNASARLAPEDFIGAESVPASFTIDGATYGASPARGAGIYLRHIWHGTVKGFYENPQNNMTAYAWTYVYSPVEQDAGALVEFYTYSRSGNEKAPSAGEWDRRGSRVFLNGEELAAPTWQQPDKNIVQNHDTEGLTNENLTAREPVSIHLNEGWNQVFMKLPHANNGGTGRDKWQFTFVITDPEGRDALENLVYSPNRCIDENAETVASLIASARNAVAAYVKDEPGYRVSTELDSKLLSAAGQAELTLAEQLTPEERAAQAIMLQQLLNEFTSGIEGVEIVLPRSDTSYYMHTPNRGSRYVTDSNGTLTGVQGTPQPAWAWQFEQRADGRFNIRNVESGLYASPSAANNTALKTVATAPESGWEVKPSAVNGLVIIVNGSAQFNQTNNGRQGFNIYNWGGGTNTTDTGCQYKLTAAGTIDIPDALLSPETEKISIRCQNRRIFVTPSTVFAEIYSPQGHKVAVGQGEIDVPRGIYIVRTGCKIEKVHVK